MITLQQHGGVFHVCIRPFVNYQCVWTGQTQELNMEEHTHALSRNGQLHHPPPPTPPMFPMSFYQ